MTQPLQSKISKSKKWIDYSSEQQNDHHQEEKQTKEHVSHNHQKLESKNNHQTKQTKKEIYQPVLSASHQPVKAHLIEDRKELLQQLKQVSGNSTWIELYVQDQKDVNYLNDKIEVLKKDKNKQIISIYPSRNAKNTWDLRIDCNLCQKWIVQGFDQKNIIKLELRKMSHQQKQIKYQSKYEQKNREYRPVKQYEPQHTASTRYQPKRVEYRQKQPVKQFYKEQSNPQQYQQKRKYIEKNPLAEQIEQKVEQQLMQRKLNKKQKVKKTKDSRFYSKNPFEFNDSD